MKTQKQTINEMIAQIIAEARKLGYSEATIWRNITPKFQTVAVYYEKRGVCFYDPFKYAKAWDKVSDLGG